MLDVIGLSGRWWRLVGIRLLSRREAEELERVVSPASAIGLEIIGASWAHLHIKVSDVATASERCASVLGGRVTLERPGFVVVGASGMSVSLSSVAVSEEERAGEAGRVPRLDHAGFDVEPAVLASVERKALATGWRVKRQGGGGTRVACCYEIVDEKLWVFGAGVTLEFAAGEEVECEEMGTDLRPRGE